MQLIVSDRNSMSIAHTSLLNLYVISIQGRTVLFIIRSIAVLLKVSSTINECASPTEGLHHASLRATGKYRRSLMGLLEPYKDHTRFYSLLVLGAWDKT
jgi:hypothetical protein